MQGKFAVMLFFLCSNACMTKYRDSSGWHGPKREVSLEIIDPAVAHVCHYRPGSGDMVVRMRKVLAPGLILFKGPF